jgi:selT/selW/selH-like putative selenoprotein
MIPSGGGRFEVVADGRLIYSKAATGRHPSHEEILDALG